MQRTAEGRIEIRRVTLQLGTDVSLLCVFLAISRNKHMISVDFLTGRIPEGKAVFEIPYHRKEEEFCQPSSNAEEIIVGAIFRGLAHEAFRYHHVPGRLG